MQRVTTITLCGFIATLATASVAARMAGFLTPLQAGPQQVERADRPAAASEQAVALELPIDILAIQAFETGEVITGQPIIADVFTERIQSLSDGNRIVRRASGRLFRDSQGRTRREQEISGIAPIVSARAASYVVINDPVEGASIVVDVHARHAVRAPLIRVDAASTVSAAPPHDPTTTAAAGSGHVSIRNEELGEKLVNGVRAAGSRSIATLAAGAIGNELPLIITTDRWRAIEHHVLLSSRTQDPRFGDTLYELRNISFTEPAPRLFSAPSGYTLDSTGITRQ